jgi:class 3 adenylate cyclase/pimeloyl-ACP methyl ester carboxylesterase
VSIAYQVAGDGPLDLVFPSIMTSPIDLLWDDASFVRVARRLGGFGRTVWCEMRGVGASGGDVFDALVDAIEDADLTAVLDAAGCERVVLVAAGYGGATAIRHAAAHPERVSALVLINTHAFYIRHEGYPWGMPPDILDRFAARTAEIRGTGETIDAIAPSKARDERFRAWWSRGERLGLAPEQLATAQVRSFGRDVRPLLPSLTVPALVLHREGDRFIRVGAGRYLADHIPNAKYVELPGDDQLFFVGDTDGLLDEIEDFLTGRRQAPEGDVVAATILFTDIVASTEQAARMGHRKWTALTDQHDAIVRAVLARYRGHEVKTMGDGFLATFDAASRAVRAATQIVNEAMNAGLEVRAGVHTGEVEVRRDDVVGLAVTIAKRICDLARPGEILVSETVKGHVVGSGIALSERGPHVLKGVPDDWRLYTPKG